MKKIFICCGTGIATSTQAREKTEVFLKEKGLFDKVDIRQGSIGEIPSILDWADLVISTAGGNSKHIPMINALPLIIGIGTDKVLSDIEENIKS
ncbi:PTS sugar transporter subunit IIB [Photobacterium carnosum]|uniref:PTS sugar transporter subunit IIB n=1 Tax=Photobacterium carnosum TaxID=2023717 RepID=UPI001C922CC5|nr:PTS sugar transporter subunit IIB [Photobacterium carnosum]MBY3790026.1 PTS sugar transporter subunit IIB [Photobacterium carnosum]MCD9528370.1 PTS galactitol transporter subunit IIB [Photobacterium carnosum]MCD9531638.1 PTS galactitol transporter subunit IIB [Photobacterium carnosum]MCD9535804.1 PTS galactitol transporter subunit IIB [Photobacterium carnosum]MCD9542742.1 PTS galactitol transporter subunit IIB [Photobacterium carnosum]